MIVYKDLTRGAVLQVGEDCFALYTGQGDCYEIYAPDFFLKESCTLTYEHRIFLTRMQLLELFPACIETVSWLCNEDLFRERFEAFYRLIEQGVIQKGVPYVQQYAPLIHRPERLFGNVLRRADPSLYLYGFWQSGEGMLGATPELFCDRSSKWVQTQAIAGTASEPSGLMRPKERYEHQLVVDDILGRLGPFGPCSFSQPEVRAFGQLYHLASDITCEAGIPVDVLMQTLHPTAALGSYPHSWDILRAQTLLEERGRFGAPFGSAERLYVAIRNIQWNDQRMVLSAGCGIVQQSDYASELHEVRLKLRAIAQILGVFE